MSKKLGEITIKGVRIICSELDVDQVEQMITMIRDQEGPSTLDWMFADAYMPERVLEEIIGRPVRELLEVGKLAPTELEPLYQRAIEVNPFLAKALDKMRELAELERGLARGLLEEIAGRLSPSSFPETEQNQQTEQSSTTGGSGTTPPS